MSWIFEIIIGFAILIAANFFWSAIRAVPFQRKLIQSSDEIKKLIAFIGEDKLKSEGKTVEPAFGSYSNNIIILLSVGIRTMDKVRNISVFATIVLLIVSFAINPWFALINFALFMLIGLMDVHSYIKNSMASDIESVILNIYKWNKVDHSACMYFCTEEKPYLRVLYQAVTELL